jgi:hypothetical protein
LERKACGISGRRACIDYVYPVITGGGRSHKIELQGESEKLEAGLERKVCGVRVGERVWTVML